MPDQTLLTDFDDDASLATWRAVDDVVMGGVSASRLERAAPGIARFTGAVSLQYGGGFASVRTEPQTWPTAGANALLVRCLGDGHVYKFTVRVDDGFDGVQYQVRFEPAREWTTVRLPITNFVATFRGRPVPGAGPLDPARIRRVGLMISDRQAGPFELLVDWIAVVQPVAR